MCALAHSGPVAGVETLRIRASDTRQDVGAAYQGWWKRRRKSRPRLAAGAVPLRQSKTLPVAAVSGDGGGRRATRILRRCRPASRPGGRKWGAEPQIVLNLDEQVRQADRTSRRASSQRRSSTRLADCSGSGCSARSALQSPSRSSSKLTCRLRGTSSRNLSKAAERVGALSCCAAESGSARNPVSRPEGLTGLLPLRLR